MIGNALRIDIEKYAADLSRRNVLFATTQAGTISRDMIRRYLASIHFMLSLTPVHLAKAARRARELGQDALAQHFEQKLIEEIGHDAWAEQDLRSLEVERTARIADVTHAVRELAAYLETTIEQNPAWYLAYIAFAEYLTVIKGPEWLDLLETRCGIPKSSMTAVDNHVELDREHAEEGFAVVDDLVTDPRMLPEMREALAKSMHHFDAYCAEAVNGSAAPTLSHVSAA
jgi:hypothetical protein